MFALLFTLHTENPTFNEISFTKFLKRNFDKNNVIKQKHFFSAFTEMDQNNDGQITQEEFIEVRNTQDSNLYCLIPSVRLWNTQDSTVLQDDQLNMALCSWYLVKSDLSGVHVYSSVNWTRHFLQGTRKTRPCLSGRFVSCFSLLCSQMYRILFLYLRNTIFFRNRHYIYIVLMSVVQLEIWHLFEPYY